jgi:hypothetical protein
MHSFTYWPLYKSGLLQIIAFYALDNIIQSHHDISQREFTCQKYITIKYLIIDLISTKNFMNLYNVYMSKVKVELYLCFF